MPLGNPIRKQNESRMVSVLATEGQTVFTVQGGYIINHISVFRNGVRLSPAEDFTAGDGSTVTLNDAANVEDRIDFHIFDRFTVQNAIVGAASTQTINGDLVLNGKLFGQLDVPSINLTGIVTATELDLNGKGDISGDLNVTGVTTVGKQIHVGTGVSIAAGGLNVTAGISTFQAVQGTTGTFSAAVSGTTGTFSGAVSGTTGTFSGVIRAKSASVSLPSSGTSLEIYYGSNILTDAPSSYLISYDRDASAYKKINYDALEHKFRTSDTLKLHINPHGVNIAGVTTTTGIVCNGDVNITDKIQHVEDSDTAIRFPAADTITAETGGSERLRIDSSGDYLFLGGTLRIKNSANNAQRGAIYGDSTSFHVNAAGNLKLYSGGGERVRFSDVGQISIRGTTTAFDTTGDLDSLQLYYETDSGQASIGPYSSGGSTHLSFYTNSGGAAATEKLRIKDNGQVLINTTDGTGAYQLVVTNPTGSDTGMSFRGGASSQQRIRFADGTSGGAESVGQIEYNHANNVLSIDVNGSNAIRIDSGQKVMFQTTTTGHTDADDLTIGDTSDNRIGITIRSAEYGNIFFSDATSGAAEYQGVLQYHHTDNVFNVNVGGPNKVTVAAQNIALFGADNLSTRGGTYYGVDLAYKGSGIQGRSNNPTLDLCSNVSANNAGNGYVYGEGNTTAGQLSIGGNQLIFSSAGSGTAGASASLTEKFRFNTSNTLIFGRTTSNAPSGSVHIANAYLRLQAANQNSGDFSQQVGIEWSQEDGSDVQVCAIKARRTSWGGAPHALDFYTRHASNSVQRTLILTETQNATLTGSLTQNASDIRLKENIQPITNALEKVNSLSGFTFNWNQKGKDLGFTGSGHDEVQVGLSAQDIEKVQPEVVKPAPINDEYKTIQYEKLVPLLVESIKELSTKNYALEARLAALEGS